MPHCIPQHHDLRGVTFLALNNGHVALIDSADEHLLEGWTWTAFQPGRSRTFYVVGRRAVNGRRESVLLHRLIMETPRELEVDHINGNGLDCRRANLRNASHAENARNLPVRTALNTSGVKGVTWDPTRKKWRAHIAVDGRHFFLGRYDDKDDAIAARRAAETELHGDFVREEL